MLRLLLSCALPACLWMAGAGQAHAAIAGTATTGAATTDPTTLSGSTKPRSATANIDRVTTAVATLQEVRVRLVWPAGAPHGELRLRARQVDAPELGYHFSDLDWRCPL